MFFMRPDVSASWAHGLKRLSGAPVGFCDDRPATSVSGSVSAHTMVRHMFARS